ncbi:hypothetical protein NKH10_28215 [Mesorhizobium sp. M1340]
MKSFCVGSVSVAAMAICITSFVSTTVHAGSIAYETGYQKAAYLNCSQTVYNEDAFGKFMAQDDKYINTRDYKRGFAALEAGLKSDHRSKVCFDAARASSSWTDR